MLRRFKRYVTYKLLSYIPGTSKLAVMEAKRLTQHICDNYELHLQILILDELKTNLIEYRCTQIENKKNEITQSEIDLKELKNNLERLINR